MNPRLPLAALAIALLPACAGLPETTTTIPSGASPATGPGDSGAFTVAERYLSEADGSDELDSLATWPRPEGGTWLIASAKATDRLVVFDADSGERLHEVGGPGTGHGRFDRPNGLAVHGDLLFVVERDNARVQVLSLPGFEPLGSFGEAQLRSPYGLWVHETEPGEVAVYVTDSFMYGDRHERVPPLDELDQRVRRFRIAFDQAGRLRAHHAGHFGATGTEDALHVVESIAGDTAHDRLLIADERVPRADGTSFSTLREYTLAGVPTGTSLPPETFAAEAEGVVLWPCGPSSGYWVAVDQLAPLTRFHLFDRETLRAAGSFHGTITAFTDGVALHAAATPTFPAGALFAVHDDQAVVAFDLGEVAGALGLAPECGG